MSFVDPPFADAPFGRDSLGRRKARPPELTLIQMETIKAFYLETHPREFDLSKLAITIGKSRQNIARFARKAGWTDPHRPNTARELENSRNRTQNQWENRPHPRGMAGKKHNDEAKAKMSRGQKLAWATQKTFGGPLVSEENRQKRSDRSRLMQALRPPEKSYSRTKGGRREDLGGQYFRSAWEANYARYLNLLMKLGAVESWDYEPTVFWFEGIKRGVTNYRPDFRVKYKGDERLVYEELKGWIVPKDRTKWARMKKYHPSIKLVIIKPKDYRAIQKKWASAIPTWEYEKSYSRRVTIRPIA